MPVEERVRKHFEADAVRFDSIYEDTKGPFTRFVDNIWRGVVRKRFSLTLQRLQPLKGKAILDVGCGSGRYCLAYADEGAARVTGIDFARPMIDLALSYAQQKGLADRCEFVTGSFPQDVPPGPYDYSTAMGFFDYVADPAPVIATMRQMTRSTMVMSFPKSREWRVPFRKVRFWMSGCPLYLYSRRHLTKLLLDAGVTSCEWIELDRDFIIVAR